MSVLRWETTAPPDPAFLERWAALARDTGQFNFTMDPAFLAHEAARGRHAIALAIDEGDRAGAAVLRIERGGLRSGWPWRWQVAARRAGEPAPPRPDAGASAWLFEHMEAAAGGRRLRLFLPAPAPAGVPSYPAGRTVVMSLAGPTEALVTRLAGNKRRAVKGAEKQGYAVVAAPSPEAMQAFARLQQTAEWRATARDAAAAGPGAGEGWREWALPWMLLLTAGRDGAVEAGSGFAFVPGGTIDYRANASTPDARKAGANVQLAFAGMVAGHARGCTAMNWGGATLFKRALGGELCEIEGWLGGGASWAAANHLEAGARRARAALARTAPAGRMLHDLAQRIRGGRSKGGAAEPS